MENDGDDGSVQQYFFELINNEKENEIKNFLRSDNIYDIWKYQNEEDEDVLTVLHMAAFKKNIEIIKILLDYIEKNNKKDFKSFINSSNKKGMTAIHFASYKGSLPIVKLLIEKGADETIITKMKLNVIHYCAEGNASSCLMYYYLRFKNKDKNNNSKLLQLFKNQDKNGSTALHWAAYSGSVEILLYLINLDVFEDENERQEFIDKKDNQERTAVHLSVSTKNSVITKKLLQYNATPSIRATLEKTPYELAIAKNLNEIAMIIKDYEKCHLCTATPVKKNKKTYHFIIYFFLCLFLSSLIILFSSIPMCLHDNLFGKIIFYAYFLLFFTFLLSYLLLLCLNPGIVQANNKSVLNELIEENKNLSKYCYKCLIPKNKSITHCVICDKCFEGFDHHCYWINKCVAKKNICLFKFFFGESLLYLIFCFSLNSITFYKIIKNNFNLETNKNNYYFWNDIIKTIFKDNYLKYVHFGGNIFLSLMLLYFFISEGILIIIKITGGCFKNDENEEKRETVQNNMSINRDISIIDENERNTLINNSASQE